METQSSTEIFVFGSNTEGRHGAGAALYALHHCGAIWGQPVGIQGKSYAIRTKDLTKVGMRTYPLWKIQNDILDFVRHANHYPELTFKVTPIGCGLAGYNPEEIALLFPMSLPENIKLPEEFIKVRNEKGQKSL